MKYYLIAGEASGDLHGANLIRALKKEDEQAKFRIIGGDQMQAESGEKAFLHTSQMSFMGFVEVLANLSSILKNLKRVKKDLLMQRPDAVVLIDFPGFNLKIAEFAKKHGIKVCYYIAPKVWAWNQKRVFKIKKSVDHLFSILPFEVEFFKKWGVQVDYVGNPLLDALSKNTPNPDFLAKHNLDSRPLVALLPGSRKMEISKLLPVMIEVSEQFPGYQFVIAGAPDFTEREYAFYFKKKPLPVLFNQTYDLLRNAKAAIVASGTATLETALLRVPEVVVYKANPLSVWLARRLVKISYISLVNLIMDKRVVQELIQEECTPKLVGEEMKRLLEDPAYRDRMLGEFDALLTLMGSAGASERTAKKIVHYLSC